MSKNNGTIRKRTWTKSTANAWINKVDNGTFPRGLKYCSAMSYLRNHSGKKGA